MSAVGRRHRRRFHDLRRMELYASFGWAKLCTQVNAVRIERVAQVVSQVSGGVE